MYYCIYCLKRLSLRKNNNMFRKIKDDLIQWKNKEKRKPLIIRGARQVGKTYVVNEFAKENFTDFLSINFEREMTCMRYSLQETLKR